MKTSKLTQLSLFSACALILFLLEAALPPLLPIPGIKLGLANIITLILLLHDTWRDALLVLFVRIILGSIFAGQAVSCIYSLCGGLLCFLAMVLMNRLLHGHYIYLTSIVGALFHNFGQILAALFLTRTPGVLAYLPYLCISGVLTGLFTGLCAHFASRFLPMLRRS